MTEHNVCRVRIRLGEPEITSNDRAHPTTAHAGGRPSPLMGGQPRFIPKAQVGEPTHQWVRMLEIPSNAYHASLLEARARARAQELFPVEQVQLDRIWMPQQFAATKAAPATGPILLTILRQQRRIEDGPGAGSYPDHRTPGNAAYLPDSEADAAAVKNALAKSQTSIAARILEVFA